MHKLMLTAVLVLGLGAPAAGPLTASDQADTRPSPAQHAASRRDHRPDSPFLVVGLTTDQTLVAFASDKPRVVKTLGRIRGLQGDQRLIGLDCRVADSTAYGVGDAGGVYRLRLADSTATKVSQLTLPLDGRAFDIDFNPAANRLRVISDRGQNLRHNLDDLTGTPPVGVTVADAPLTIPPATQAATGVTGAAYYNNDLDPDTATALFTLDTTGDQVAIQSPANAGLLAATGTLGVDVEAGSDAGFDIHYTQDGASADGRGLAALKVNGTYRLYRVELLTGKARLVGAFPASRQVTDLTAGFNRDELETIFLGEDYSAPAGNDSAPTDDYSAPAGDASIEGYERGGYEFSR
jgi:hypothetical protein